MTKKAPRKAKFFKPQNALKQKVGTGGLDETILNKAETFISDNTVEFEPIAKKFIHSLAQALKNAEKDTIAEKKRLQDIVTPVMELKANGGMFRYFLLSDIANVSLNFLESLDSLNKDAIRIAELHYKTMHLIIAKRLSGDGGKEGKALLKELSKASDRYFKRYTA